MEEIIPEIDRELILSELTEERRLRSSNKAHNEIYVLDARSAPNTMREIGRLREIAFRSAGGGTGKACDIDEYDLMDPPCRQLIVWDPEHNAIVGGYRFILGSDIQMNPDGTPRIATSHLFKFSDKFLKEILPYTIELGRSFVSTDYQASGNAQRALYALDNLWDGLGALTVIYPEIKYLFGKMTMYPSFGQEERNLILYFLKKHFPDPDNLAIPHTPLPCDIDEEEMKRVLTEDDFKADYKILHSEIRKRGKNIPPLINAYMSLSPTMRMFGTAINTEFGDVEESGILLTLDDIFEEKKKRHIGTFMPKKNNQ
ncbi:MAG: GNAT family N-acetyltransferase [Muribaculaceae bacterium]|nr:GNAT family N-acetyltransferase [Muribaculaceae bacterium]